MTTSEILTMLEGVQNHGSHWTAKCPAHPDDKPSMSVTEGKDGRILLHCHAGCTPEAITAALGIKLRDLMPPKPEPLPKPKSRRVVATYDYEDENGTKIYRVTRFEPKGFMQSRYVGNGGVENNMKDVRRVPFHLPKVMAQAAHGKSVIIVEGEKDVMTAESLGAVATCNAGGAGKWDPEWSRYFVGCSRVFIVADNDPVEKNYPGQRHAYAIREALRAAGVDAVAFTMPEGKDFSDWVAAGHDKHDFAQLLRNPPSWPPEWEFNVAPDAEEPIAYNAMTLADFPDYIPEEKNPNILVKGRWLERGGSAFWISTAGTGKSVACLQLAMCWTEGLPFADLVPLRTLRIWIIQSEDSPDRVTLDREGIIAELSETHPDVDWRATCRKIVFVKFPGQVGADFLDALDSALAVAADKRPDVVIINPFLAYVGGPVVDGAYVTPFLRGGEINRKPTVGLQDILERHRVAVLCYHHTPKPPSDKELDQWMKSQFPEYQGAGSSDITNWGRSFLTMMKVKGHRGVVCITAGKNGNDLGWEEIDGAYRRYMAFARGIGVDGRRRHAWRDLDAEEFAEITKAAATTLNEDVEKLVAALREEAMNNTQLARKLKGTDKPDGISTRRFDAAWKVIKKEPDKYGLTTAKGVVGKQPNVFYGVGDAPKNILAEAQRNYVNATQI